MKAVIMAGGKGSRLRPLSCDLPKPMVPILNRPMLEHILNLLRSHGITDVAITICYLPEQIMDYFGDGSQWGMRINYYVEEQPLGTAGSVQNAAELLNETFLVISGDALTDFDLSKAYAYHRSKGALATQVLTRVDVPLEYGVVITDSSGRIRQFLEKPSWSEVFSDTVNTGIYILEPEIFDYYPAGVAVDFSKDLFPYLLKKGEPLFGHIADGYWSDVGNLEIYRLSHFDMLEMKVKVRFEGHQLAPDVWVGLGSIIEPGAVVKGPCYIGRNCQISRGAEIGEYTVVGDNCTIMGDSAIKRSVLWNNVYLGPGSEVKGAVLADQVVLKERSAVLEGAVVGKGSYIGRHVLIKPNVRVWPDKHLSDRLVLKSSLVWGSRSPQNLFGSTGVSGAPNIDITAEQSAKLGAAFGCFLGPKARVVVAADGERASRVMKRAAISGLLSVGVDVSDLGLSTVPVLRHVVTRLGLKGGLMISSRAQDLLSLEFLDASGFPLNKGSQRSMENLFFREDFNRPTPEYMGDISFLPSGGENYLASIFGESVLGKLTESRLKAFVGYGGAAAKGVVATLESMLPPGMFFSGFCSGPKELGGAVTTYGCDLGMWLDTCGQQFGFADEHGRLLSEESQWNLLSYGMLLRGRREIAVPVSAPASVEQIAAKFGAKVVRTKANPYNFLELEPPPQGLPAYDGLAALALTLGILYSSGLSLSRVIEEFPILVRKTTNVDCSWEAKGKVMRSLLEATQDQTVQLLDGVKVFHQQGWALVWPDAEEPLFHIISEANTSEEADALSQMYAKKISGFVL